MLIQIEWPHGGKRSRRSLFWSAPRTGLERRGGNRRAQEGSGLGEGPLTSGDPFLLLAASDCADDQRREADRQQAHPDHESVRAVGSAIYENAAVLIHH